MESRLGPHLRKLGFKNFEDYLNFTLSSEGRDEFEYFITRITTHTTSFFREDSHFTYLFNHGINLLLRQFNPSCLNCMSLGASTGEEAYSLALVFMKYADLHKGFNFEIDLSDISSCSLKKAKNGEFKLSQLSQIPKLYLPYIQKNNTWFTFIPAIKQRMSFFKLNICNPQQRFPRTYHIVFCRNTLIYFSKEKQQIIMQNIERILKDGGLLFLGHSETLQNIKCNLKKIRPTVYQKEIVDD